MFDEEYGIEIESKTDLPVRTQPEISLVVDSLKSLAETITSGGEWFGTQFEFTRSELRHYPETQMVSAVLLGLATKYNLYMKQSERNGKIIIVLLPVGERLPINKFSI